MYLRTNNNARTYISGVIFLAFPQNTLITTYEITPNAIPSEMLYIRGMQSKQMYAGIASVRLLKSISVTAETIRNPTNTSAGAIAKPGIAMNTGERNIAKRKRTPVTIDERPVLPPSATPDELSTKVVVVDVPRTAPALVAM